MQFGTRIDSGKKHLCGKFDLNPTRYSISYLVNMGYWHIKHSEIDISAVFELYLVTVCQQNTILSSKAQ